MQDDRLVRVPEGLDETAAREWCADNGVEFMGETQPGLDLAPPSTVTGNRHQRRAADAKKKKAARAEAKAKPKKVAQAIKRVQRAMAEFNEGAK